MFEQQESLAGGDLRGNRPLKRNHRDKPQVVGTVKRKLPRNWYEDTWFKSLPAGQQSKLDVMPYRPIPTPVRSKIALHMAINHVLPVGSIFTAKGTDGNIVGALVGRLLGHRVAQEWPFLIFGQRNQISFLTFIYGEPSSLVQVRIPLVLRYLPFLLCQMAKFCRL